MVIKKVPENVSGGINLSEADLSFKDVNQQILEEIHDHYVKGTKSQLGLCDLAKRYSLQVVVPKRNIWVVLLGNHSAGKSSFINWYVEETVQKTSVAIETTGFTLVTAGKKRETLTGPATVQLFPFLKDLSEFKGILSVLSTEIVPTRAKKLNLITLIDTPGLVDGDMKYPFDPEEALLRIAEEADLIFSFFDPIGQALCARTMNIIEKVCDKHGHKIHFYLSKADTVPDETDRQRVLIQIAQNLTHRIKDRQFSLNIPPIYIPREEDQVPVRNHIDGVLEVIDGAVNLGVQNSLQALEDDCKKIKETIAKRLEDDDSIRSYNQRDCGRGFWLLSVSLTPLMVLLAVFVHRMNLESFKGIEALTTLDSFASALPQEVYLYSFAASAISLTLWLLFVKKRKTLTTYERTLMEKHYEFVNETLPKRHQELYQQYFEATLGNVIAPAAL